MIVEAIEAFLTNSYSLSFLSSLFLIYYSLGHLILRFAYCQWHMIIRKHLLRISYFEYERHFLMMTPVIDPCSVSSCNLNFLPTFTISSVTSKLSSTVNY